MPRISCSLVVVLAVTGLWTVPETPAADARAVELLRKEVAEKGFLVASIKQKRGDWDLVLMRPDGSHQRKLTHPPGARRLPAGLPTAAGCSTDASRPAP